MGKKVSYEDLSPPVISKNNEYEANGLSQDFYNALVGSLVVVLIIALSMLFDQ